MVFSHWNIVNFVSFSKSAGLSQSKIGNFVSHPSKFILEHSNLRRPLGQIVCGVSVFLKKWTVGIKDEKLDFSFFGKSCRKFENLAEKLFGTVYTVYIRYNTLFLHSLPGTLVLKLVVASKVWRANS